MCSLVLTMLTQYFKTFIKAVKINFSNIFLLTSSVTFFQVFILQSLFIVVFLN